MKPRIFDMNARTWVVQSKSPIKTIHKDNNDLVRYLITSSISMEDHRLYIEFNKCVRPSYVKKLITSNQPYIIYKRTQNRDDIRKLYMSGEYNEMGNWDIGGQGRRTDLVDLR